MENKRTLKTLALLVCIFLLSASNAPAETCNGDFDCDGDVDGTDAVEFKADFFRKDCIPCQAPVPQTGQTLPYYSGDDGDLRMGFEWPDPRFTDHEDGTVTDNLTGFMWTKDANLPGTPKMWDEAMAYVAEMNVGTHENFGYTNWRLPNVRELFSLIDFGTAYPALLPGHPFINVEPAVPPPTYFWSSTTFGNEFWTTYAWRVCTTAAAVNVDPKTDTWYVWPVRELE